MLILLAVQIKYKCFIKQIRGQKTVVDVDVTTQATLPPNTRERPIRSWANFWLFVVLISALQYTHCNASSQMYTSTLKLYIHIHSLVTLLCMLLFQNIQKHNTYVTSYVLFKTCFFL